MPETSTETHSLIFHWKNPVLRARSLIFWMFVVLLGLAAFFYLFQVVYPQAQRFTPVPHHIVALNSADPATREIMNKVQDVDFLILPQSSEASGAASLEKHSPVFHPTFEGHTLQLQDLPQETFTVPPARLLQMEVPVLPPLDLSELKVIPVAKPVMHTPRLTVRFTDSLALRVVTHMPDLSGIALNDPSGCRFQLGVNAGGIVEVALPLASSETPETMQKLNSAMRETRFAPATSKTSAPVWGTATFQWGNTAP